MEPLLVLVLSVGGVLAIVLVCWLAGGTRTAVIADPEAARAQLRIDEPEFPAERVLVAGDGRTALVANHSGSDIAAVMVFGDKLVTRRFAHGGIRAVSLREQPPGRVLTVLTDDPTCRRIEVVLDGDSRADGADRVGFWVSAMERLRQDAGQPGRVHAEEA